MNIGIIAPFNPMFVKDYLMSENIPDINNAASAVNTLVLSLLQSGHSVKIFTACEKSTSIKKIVGINLVVYIVPESIWYSRPQILRIKHTLSLGLTQLYMPQRLRKVIKTEVNSLDVLHAHWTYEYAMSAHYFSNMKPVFVTVRDWAPYIRSIQKNLIGRLIWWQKFRVFKIVMADDNICFIANSQYTYDRITRNYPDKFVTVIPNPIKKENIIKKKLKNDIIHQFISISQNLGDPRKNVIVMLKAFQMYKKEYPEAQLHLIGFYDEHSEYYNKWKSGGLLTGVILHGRLPYNELMRLLDDMSCLIHPSLEETFGNILLEAMARCVPCIGGEKSGAVPQVLGNGEYGLLCDVCDPKAIYDSMCKMSDMEYAESLSKKATDMLCCTYSSDIIAKQHIELFLEILGKRRKEIK